MKAAEKGIPVIIMEPLLGGKLATGLPKKAFEIFKTANSSLSPAAWALRWLWNQKEVTVVLSGMNEMSQLEENIEIANDAEPGMFSQEEDNVIESVVKEFNSTNKILCTGCNYCMPCSHNVNIPACFSSYNILSTVGFISGMQMYVTSTGSMNPEKKYAASNCTECGNCEKKCPQNIPIIQSLKMVRKKMEPFWLRPAVNLYMRFMS